MNRSMLTSATTVGQLQKKLDTIANNVANINTHGFKRREVQFSDLLFQQINNQPVAHHEIGRNTPNGIRTGTGAKVGNTNIRMEQGSILETGRSLDLAFIEEKMFFEVLPKTEGGERRFMRDGLFYLTPNPENEDEVFLVTGSGDFVMSREGTAITLPAEYDEIKINESGLISVTQKIVAQIDPNDPEQIPEQIIEIPIAQLQVVKITKPQLLINNGDNFFSFTNLDALQLTFADVLEQIPETEAVMRQGALEAANVDLAQEMSELILAQRLYQFNVRSISIADQMLGLVNGLRG